MITADTVLNTAFSATRFRKGYDMEQVDLFLDRVVATLRAHEGAPRPQGARASDDVRAREVHEQQLPTTAWREGYDATEVDAFLDRVATTLEEHERRGALPVADRATGDGATPTDRTFATDPPADPSADVVPTGPTIGLREATALLRSGQARPGPAGDTLTVVTTDGVTLHVVESDSGPDGAAPDDADR